MYLVERSMEIVNDSILESVGGDDTVLEDDDDLDITCRCGVLGGRRHAVTFVAVSSQLVSENQKNVSIFVFKRCLIKTGLNFN